MNTQPSIFVGIPGFEPGTSNSRSWRANRTALHPETIIGNSRGKGSVKKSIDQIFPIVFVIGFCGLSIRDCRASAGDIFGMAQFMSLGIR